MTLLPSVFGFVVCAVIIDAGTRLSVYGDRIAELTGLGKAWIGLVLMASITFLPELISDIARWPLAQKRQIAYTGAWS